MVGRIAAGFFAGSVLFITHDRRFLDNVATRIIELDRGNLTTFPGKFSDYQTKKAEMLEVEAAHNQKFDKVPSAGRSLDTPRY
jgi:ATP-binding cassette subfamily F protein uup